MSADTRVTIYFGPLSWLHEELGAKEWQYLLDIVNAQDDERRRITHTIEGQEVPSEKQPAPRPKKVVAESADYASVQEHAIINFVGLIRSINPEHLVLHNPPARIHTQLAREFQTEVKRYDYPAITRDTLIAFQEGFQAHLVGQAAVKEALLAALYPLTTGRRSTPMVLMFYGPSGVGKTETAQFVNSLLGGTLLRRQFSMYHSDKFASYLFGGTHSEDSFSRDLLDRQSGVILLDEFDKAHAVFHGAFYQLFDGGIFEDKNYRVEVGPSLIICTSNYGTDEEIRQALGEALYSRFDALVHFGSLTKSEICQVIDRIFAKNYAALEPEEQRLLDAGELKPKLYRLAEGSGNVRKLGKMIEGAIALKLVRAVLREDEQATVEREGEGAA